MSFDLQGRMWLTQSFEYPFADSSGIGTDRISILEDSDGDGEADRISVFADSLNIPIGITPVPDGAIAFSIPNVWHFIDHDGDDQVDERKVLYSGFGYDDTHGMVNNFVRHWDGWIHADHGFSNTSRVAGSDGDTLVMQSGNTIRFRLDGSRIEFTTTGRVNPYGYAFDEWGYTYSVDCHTSPVYQLIRGADYPHFSKKPTGIGFGPALMKHEYGSTALAGLEYYIADAFPEQYQESFYYGDVVRSRVSRSKFILTGTTPKINQEEDFVISDDPWFRPVDIKLGPDGALYVADFYNRIIGHYEVPLDHPGRDRQRGRIWRITATNLDDTRPNRDWSNASLQVLINNLNHPNLPLRMQLADRIVDRFGDVASDDVKNAFDHPQTPILSRVQLLWILYRLEELDQDRLLSSLTGANDTIKVHALRILYERKDRSPELLSVVNELANHSNPHVQRQAVMVLSLHPHRDHLRKLMQLLKMADPGDSHLYYSLRQSLRDQIRNQEILAWVLSQDWPETDSRLLSDVMVGVDDHRAASFLTRHLEKHSEHLDTLLRYAQHAARWMPSEDMDKLANVLQVWTIENPSADYQLFEAALTGIKLDDKKLTGVMSEWSRRLAARFLKDPVGDYNGWSTKPVERRPYSENTWILVDTILQDHTGIFLSSGRMFGRGSGTSIMYSPDFDMPSSLTFVLAGQKNLPREDQKPSPPDNRIELVHAKSQRILEFREIDKSNFVEAITWQAGNYEGDPVYLRLEDGSTLWGEYIAIANLPALLSLPSRSPKEIVKQQVFAAEMAATVGMEELVPSLQQILSSPASDVIARGAAAGALTVLESDLALSTMKTMLDDSIPMKLRDELLVAMSSSSQASVLSAIPDRLNAASYRAQLRVINNLVSSKIGIDIALDAARDNTINPRLLRDPGIEEILTTSSRPHQEKLFHSIIANIAPPSEEIQQKINRYLRDYNPAMHSVEKGQSYFAIFCGTCHQAQGQGAEIGPQLNGIGHWGARALTEKILDPNRNVSRAFVTYTIHTEDGKVQSGLFLRDDGSLKIFANSNGQEFSIRKEDINEQNLSPYTIMPDHFYQTIPEEDFKDLLAYLLTLKGDALSNQL